MMVVGYFYGNGKGRGLTKNALAAIGVEFFSYPFSFPEFHVLRSYIIVIPGS